MGDPDGIELDWDRIYLGGPTIKKTFALLTLLAAFASCQVPIEEFPADAFVVRFSNSNEYVVEMLLSDPSHRATTVTITGTGIVQPYVAIYNQHGDGNWWGPNVSLGSSTPPPLPATYEFQVATGDESRVVGATASEYFGEFAVPVFPVATDTVASTGFTFVWNPAAATNCVEYAIQLDGHFWQKNAGSATSIAYDGPSLAAGAHQYYVSSMPKGCNTSSLVSMSFNVAP